MTRVLKGFIEGYNVLNRDGNSIGQVVSCILDLEQGIITHVEMNVHDHSVLLPFRNCLIYHRDKCIKFGI
jgi:ribosomal 30S subunit maturation factor RimM